MLTLLVLKLEYLCELDFYHACWCLGSLCHQVISNHSIKYAGKIPCACAILVLRNYRKCKHMSSEINSGLSELSYLQATKGASSWSSFSQSSFSQAAGNWNTSTADGSAVWDLFGCSSGLPVERISMRISIGNVTLVVITGITVLVPFFLKSSHCNPFEDKAPVDFIYRCLIFKWVVVTWLHDRVRG